jgi:CheY-like chemotaxis protein
LESGLLLTEIEDSGVGISENELGNLFRQFEQASAGIRTSSGTGLGLALSRELAVLMGGNITVTSEEGKGSVFSFSVAVRIGVTDTHDKKNNKRIIGIMNPSEQYRILVVDDKEENRKVAADLLNSVGFEVNEAVNGKEAIAIFEQWNPHLILMDMRMPVMDGYEATNLIKSTEKGKQTPVVAITASLFEDDKAKAITHDIDGYIRKPFRENELFNTIGQILGLVFITEEEKPANPPSKYMNNPEAIVEDMARLPENLRAQMLNKVEAADFHQVIELIKNIESDNPDLADHLIDLADNYDYTRLAQIFKKEN